jgi:uncharacterized membrane protein (DUF4010 family)
MNQAKANQIVFVNLAFWFVAMVLHPVSKMLPTGAGSPPKIFEVLIPIVFILLAGGSTYLLKAAMGRRNDD